MKRQPALVIRRKKIRRIPATGVINPVIDRLVTQAAMDFGVSKSWVVHTALAEFFKVDIIRYNEGKKK